MGNLARLLLCLAASACCARAASRLAFPEQSLAQGLPEQVPELPADWEWEELDPDCEESIDGSFAVTQGPTVCILNVTGADEVAGRQGGSIDGVYKAFSCMDGHAAFYRLDSPEDDERVLWYSETDRDWNINAGLVPDPAHILAFGGEGDAEPRPNMVPAHRWWFVRSELRRVEDMFLRGENGLRIECLMDDPDVDL